MSPNFKCYVFRIVLWSIVTCLFFFNGVSLFTITAQAYIDPSAVTYVIQAVAGVVIAIGACLTIFRHKIIAFFKKGKVKDKKQEIHFIDEDDTSNDPKSEDGE